MKKCIIRARIIITSVHHVCILLQQSMYVCAYCMYGIGFRLLRRPSINFGDAELKRDYSGRTNGTGTIHLTTKNPTPHHAQPVSMVCIPARVVLYCDSQYAQYIHIMHTSENAYQLVQYQLVMLNICIQHLMHTTSQSSMHTRVVLGVCILCILLLSTRSMHRNILRCILIYYLRSYQSSTSKRAGFILILQLVE